MTEPTDLPSTEKIDITDLPLTRPYGIEPPEQMEIEKLLASRRVKVLSDLPAPTFILNAQENYGAPPIIEGLFPSVSGSGNIFRQVYAVFERYQTARSSWTFVGKFDRSQLKEFWTSRSPDAEYRIFHVPHHESIVLTDEGDVIEPSHPEPIEIPWHFKEGPENEEATYAYEASVEAAIEILQASNWSVEDKISDIFGQNEVVGDTLQSLVMAAYQQALVDVLTDKIDIFRVHRGRIKAENNND